MISKLDKLMCIVWRGNYLPFGSGFYTNSTDNPSKSASHSSDRHTVLYIEFLEAKGHTPLADYLYDYLRDPAMAFTAQGYFNKVINNLLYRDITEEGRFPLYNTRWRRYTQEYSEWLKVNKFIDFVEVREVTENDFTNPV